MSYRAPILLLALIGLFGAPVQAWSDSDTVYIGDMLRVGVRPQPDSRATPVGVVTTGMQLEVLGRRGDYLQIRTDKGLTGWIKEIYAVEEPPAMILLTRFKEQQAGRLEALEELRESVRTLEEANSSLNEQLDQIKAERSKLQLRLARDATRQNGNISYWVFWLLGLLVAVIAAFAGGVSWQRRQTTRRLGGLRL